MPNVCRGCRTPVKFTRCPIFAGDLDAITYKLYPASCIGMLCTMYTQILKVVYTYHSCVEMYHEVLSLIQTVHINGMLCTAWLE